MPLWAPAMLPTMVATVSVSLPMLTPARVASTGSPRPATSRPKAAGTASAAASPVPMMSEMSRMAVSMSGARIPSSAAIQMRRSTEGPASRAPTRPPFSYPFWAP